MTFPVDDNTLLPTPLEEHASLGSEVRGQAVIPWQMQVLAMKQARCLSLIYFSGMRSRQWITSGQLYMNQLCQLPMK